MVLRSRIRARTPRRRRLQSNSGPTSTSRLLNAAPERPYHNIHRFVNKAYVTSTAAADGLYAYIFAGTDIGDFSSFSSVFDQYRIDRIEVQIMSASQPPFNGNSLQFAPLVAAVDFDDSTIPANWQEVANYSNAIVLPPGRSKTIKFSPRFDVGAGTSVVPARVSTGWLDCSYGNIGHYGLKIAVLQSTSTNQSFWYLICRYTVSFRQSR